MFSASLLNISISINDKPLCWCCALIFSLLDLKECFLLIDQEQSCESVHFLKIFTYWRVPEGLLASSTTQTPEILCNYWFKLRSTIFFTLDHLQSECYGNCNSSCEVWHFRWQLQLEMKTGNHVALEDMNGLSVSTNSFVCSFSIVFYHLWFPILELLSFLLCWWSS